MVPHLKTPISLKVEPKGLKRSNTSTSMCHHLLKMGTLLLTYLSNSALLSLITSSNWSKSKEKNKIFSRNYNKENNYFNFFGHKSNFMTVGIKIILLCSRYTKEQARELHHAPRHRYQKLSCIDSAIRALDNRLALIMCRGLDLYFNLISICAFQVEYHGSISLSMNIDSNWRKNGKF